MNHFEKTLELFGDYRFEMTVADYWEGEVDSVYMYFYSNKFATLMSEMFKDAGNAFVDYLPRKLRKDTSGCLAMGMPGVEHSAKLQCQVFYNSGEEIDVSEYYRKVEAIHCPENLIAHLFSFQKNMVADIERYWVYLYLLCEAGLRDASILASSTQDQYANRWGSSKEVDTLIATEFLRVYEKTPNKQGQSLIKRSD